MAGRAAERFLRIAHVASRYHRRNIIGAWTAQASMAISVKNKAAASARRFKAQRGQRRWRHPGAFGRAAAA